MELSVDGEARKRANLRVLQRLDNQTIDIIGLATHVVLYEFSTSNNQWDKCQVEGSLFLTQRSMAPTFQLIVLNRNSTHNLEVDITSTFQMQLREPYLIFRDIDSAVSGGAGGNAGTTNPTASKIRGLWFHDGNERNTMFTLLQKVVGVQNELEKKTELASTSLSNNNNNNNNNNNKPAVSNNINNDSHNIAASMVSNNAITASSAPVAALMGALAIAPNPISTSHHNNMNNGSISGAATKTTATTTTTLHSSVSSPLASTAAASTPQAHHSTSAATSTSTSSTAAVASTETRLPLPNSHNFVFDKKSLQLSLLSLIQDDRFLDLIHAQYLKVAHARANRNANHNSTNT